MGIGLDWGGFGFELIPPAEMTEILSIFPRLKVSKNRRLRKSLMERMLNLIAHVMSTQNAPVTGHEHME